MFRKNSKYYQDKIKNENDKALQQKVLDEKLNDEYLERFRPKSGARPKIKIREMFKHINKK